MPERKTSSQLAANKTHQSAALRPDPSAPSVSEAQLIEQTQHALERDCDEVHHVWHFVITLATLGVWALVWWHLILRAQGKKGHLFHGFDDAYWSYLIEREQPPAALHRQQFDKPVSRSYRQFDA